ncbi:hypothetical protein HBI56_190100 [Parastagonospora nodorum]|uniref:Uncharacterized protein n=1 Tax=Phaeosphaeria nodorum (strain SN15 / ATCC MYA-4574 / FGSC 10173) TaxID=321614 RepID=A0A7U2F9Z0_PHANO|nr:hypothetical protein HBH56_144360 [Parastagonospora nodorum]QRD01412.1 hypothetical protein JI435_416560 [Parastagonospora nodorum SN15]KAH3927790.1 hypothetical protein HBH54_149550 [Parastagonospora nodorum]KAH3947929.1 hypothetical protein HBH53_109590 [Parastagonospora nodorum]KAH3960240.1 hypothetical protein HBH51_193410 [Parastagonospora nodorum]
MITDGIRKTSDCAHGDASISRNLSGGVELAQGTSKRLVTSCWQCDGWMFV